MRLCQTCGCQERVHEHYRNGTDCGVCGPEVCDRFRPKRWSLVEWLRRTAEPPTFSAVSLGTRSGYPAAMMCDECGVLVGVMSKHRHR